MSSHHENPKIAPGAILLDRYKAVRVVGAGGMGMVVHAVHLIEGTEVAIKFLLPQFASSKEAAQRFVREARAASKVPSDHITKVLDTGTSAELGPYIAMEFLPGDDLSKHVRAGLRASIPVAVDYIVQAADALAHAHTVGVIHRDVKPANMFLVKEAEGAQLVKVLDFGISKVVEEAPLEITKTSTLLGSGLYMSPEQMRSAKTVDHRTDIYSLGISMYELFCGTQPFTADSYPDLCIKVMMHPADPLRRHRPDVPEELAAVIGKAYARAPADRYQSVPEFAAALAPWANEETKKRIEAIAVLGRARPPMASSDLQSVLPPPLAMPHPGSTTLPMAPIPKLGALPEIASEAARQSSPDERASQPALDGQRQSVPEAPRNGDASSSMRPPPLTPSSALAESSAKSFTKTAASDSTARTVMIAAGGTFAVGCLLVLGYVMVLNRHSASSAQASAGSPSAPIAGQTASPGPSVTPVPRAASAPTDSALQAGTPPPEVSATADSSAAASPDASSSASPGKHHKVPKVPASAGAHPLPPPPGADPYNCIDPVTKLRGPCR